MLKKYLGLFRVFQNSLLVSQKWSILLLIVVISGFMLVAFSTLSGKIRTELSNRLALEEYSPLFYTELERVRVTKDAFSGARISPEWVTLEVQKRGGDLYIYSKNTTEVSYIGTGSIQLNLVTPGTQVCYQDRWIGVWVPPVPICTGTGLILDKTGGTGWTGSLHIRTLGWFAKMNTVGTSSWISLGIPVYFEITAPVGNLVLPITILKTYY
jgi:hypothetical protein